MTVNAFLTIKRTPEIVRKLERLGITEKGFMDIEKIIQISEEDFSNHNKKFEGKEPHLAYEIGDGIYTHYPDGCPTSQKIVSVGHGFMVWIRKDEIIFVAPAHWDYKHGEETLEDLKEWIRMNLKEKIEIIEESVG